MAGTKEQAQQRGGCGRERAGALRVAAAGIEIDTCQGDKELDRHIYIVTEVEVGEPA